MWVVRTQQRSMFVCVSVCLGGRGGINITVSQNGSEASGEPGAHVKAVVGLAANRRQVRETERATPRATRCESGVEKKERDQQHQTE
jgi:hypothetical protein